MSCSSSPVIHQVPPHLNPRVQHLSESVRLLTPASSTSKLLSTHSNSNLNSNAASSSSSSASSSVDLSFDPLRQLNVASLSLLIFFAVCGGPYGMEGAVSAAPPLLILFVFAALPWIWSLPIGLTTSELAAAFPDEGGGPVEWVHEAFGVASGRVAALWYWLSCTTDNVLYAVLLPFYLEHAIGVSFGFEGRYALGALMLVVIGVINVLGIDVLNSSSMLLGAVALIPVVILCALAVPYQDPYMWLSMSAYPDSTTTTTTTTTSSSASDGSDNVKIQWGLLLALSVWGNSGYDDLGSLVEHVDNPQRTYPRAMFLTCFLVTFVNTIPILMSMCVDHEWQNFGEGYFAVIGETLGGRPLRIAITLGSAVALFSELNVLLLVTAKAVQYVGKQHMLPIPRYMSHILTLERGNGAPWVAIIVTVVLTSSLLFFDFELMAELHTGYYAIVIGLELVSVIYLRIARPDLHRPYVIPGGLVVLCLMCVFPFFIICFNLSLTSRDTQLVMAGTAALSLIVVLVTCLTKSNEWHSLHEDEREREREAAGSESESEERARGGGVKKETGSLNDGRGVYESI